MTAPPSQPSTPASSKPLSLWLALENRTLELEIALSWLGRAVSSIMFAISAVWWYFVAPEAGPVLLTASLIGLVWFWCAGFLLGRREYVQQVRWANPVFEVLIPGLALVALTHTHGAAYALGSWAPPMLYVGAILASVIRLRPEIPAVMGVLAAVEFLAIYYAICEPQLNDPNDLLRIERVQWVRATSLILAGLGSAGGVVAMRNAVESAGREVRKQELFGKYRLIEKIASGGMGSVWHADYSPEGGFSRSVAIKLVHPHLAQDEAFMARFRAEAELTARLTHPNIVATLDFGAVDDTYFLAMEFVDGPTLREVREHVMAAGIPLQPALVAHIGRELAEALHFAHEVARDSTGQPLRVIHRDISPANVLIDRLGQIKLSDFGVARVLRDQSQVVTGTLTGKPAYMAPELLRQDPFDARVDLFSLGVMLWELLCGERLFHRDAQTKTMLAVLEDRIPLPSEKRPDIGEHWDAVIAKALARNPDDRYRSAMELSQALQRALGAEGGVSANAIAQLVLQVEDVEELPLDFTSEEAFLEEGLITGEVPLDHPEDPVLSAGGSANPAADDVHALMSALPDLDPNGVVGAADLAEDGIDHFSERPRTEELEAGPPPVRSKESEE